MTYVKSYDGMIHCCLLLLFHYFTEYIEPFFWSYIIHKMTSMYIRVNEYPNPLSTTYYSARVLYYYYYYYDNMIKKNELIILFFQQNFHTFFFSLSLGYYEKTFLFPITFYLLAGQLMKTLVRNSKECKKKKKTMQVVRKLVYFSHS